MAHRSRPVPAYVMIFQEAYEELLLEEPLTRTEQRLLNLCLTRCEFGGEVPLSHLEMGQLVGIYPSEVSRGMARLARAGFILREPTEKGKGWRYRLPTTLFHRGHLDDLLWTRLPDQMQQHQQRHNGPHGSSLPSPPTSTSAKHGWPP